MSKFAATAQTFLLNQRSAMLATHSVANPGYPLGSVVPYDIDSSMRFFIYISFIAEHYRNLCANQRACMLICHSSGVEDPQQYARASALVNFAVVPDDQRRDVEARYIERFPTAVNYELAHNFTFMCGSIERIRWIGGFGEIGWISPQDLGACIFDQTAYLGAEIIKHMNIDHRDTLQDMARAFFSAKESERARMLSVNSNGFELEWFEKDQRRVEKVEFEQPLSSAADARAAMISLSRKAKQALLTPH